MKFDFVIGNPPYQENISDDENNSSLSKQLFPLFIQSAIETSNCGVVMITPSRWFAGDAQDKSFVKSIVRSAFVKFLNVLLFNLTILSPNVILGLSAFPHETSWFKEPSSL